MPPSPALRCSPGRELRGDNHKRGRSLEGGIVYREKDDDLALFNEMETREKDNFLLQSNDDFEDILSSKFRYFSSNKLGVSIPARGESSDLLNADAEKNDYDWLLTPPDTPLFRSLDDETPTVTLPQRGRPRSKPITISRSSTMEKTYMSSRGSASPSRLSLSPRSVNSTIPSRPSSTTRSSPTRTLRGTTPPRGPSPPPNKSSSPVPRSSTPTSRRPSATSSFGKRAASPSNNKTRGNSASPKAKAWQTNIPGFSLEAPPNLRTSLGDRPNSYVRGSSPARQSMSPTASRSASSSHSHKGSIASSGDDDVDSIQSAPRRGGAYASNHSPSLSRKSNRPGLSSSAPKRSFESALRQMDHHRKVPQNMFRPLLSSVPSSTFYVGKSTSPHRSLVSRNSSVTTSSNASSDPSPAGAHDAEGNDHNQYDIASRCEKTPYTDTEDDIFILENTDSIGKDIDSPTIATATPEILDAKSKFLEIDTSAEDKVICYECGRIYLPVEFTDGELNLCPDCRKSDKFSTTTSPVPAVIVPEISRNISVKILDDYSSVDAVKPSTSVSGFSEPSASQCDKIADENIILYPDPDLNLSTRNASGEITTTGHNSSSDGDNMVQNIKKLRESPSLKLDVSEGTGISILLKRSSSAKGPFVQSRSFTATSISFDDLSYVRDCPASMRSSTSSLDINTKHRRSGSSLSGTSSHTFHGIGVSNNEIIVVNDGSEPCEEQSIASESAKFDEKCTEIVCEDHGETEQANILSTIDSVEGSVTSLSNIDDSGSYNDTQGISDGENGLVSCDDDVAEIPNHSTLETISEIEIENGHPGSPDSQSDVGFSDSSAILDELHESSASTRSNKDVTALIEECEFSDRTRDNPVESTVTVELGTNTKSLTLEEATDAILFCSSIVHNLAYQAATIAIENENSVPLEGSLPSVTILGNSNFDNTKEPRGRTLAKRTPKSQKTRKNRMETDTEPKTKPLSGKDTAGTYEKINTRIVGLSDRSDSMNPPKLESKCNCTIM